MKIKVNNDFIKTFGQAFKDPYTVFKELLQNSRRARATEVFCDYNSETREFTLEDNGHGIRNLETLFSVNESVWDAAILLEEKPFGFGFLSTLYESEYLRVESNNQVFEVRPLELLEMADRDVGSVYPHYNSRVSGTKITLKLKFDFHYTRFHKMVEEYSLPILWGEEKAFLNPENSRDKVYSLKEWGAFVIHSKEGETETDALLRTAKLCDYCHRYYFQDFPITVDSHKQKVLQGPKIFLDIHKVEPTLPDRSQVRDFHSIEDPLTEALKDVIYEELLKTPKALRTGEGYTALKALGKLDYYNDKPWIPAGIILTLEETPELSVTGRLELFHTNKSAIPKSKTPKRLFVTDRDFASDYLDNSTNIPQVSACWAKGISILYGAALHRDHWIYKRDSVTHDDLSLDNAVLNSRGCKTTLHLGTGDEDCVDLVYLDALPKSLKGTCWVGDECETLYVTEHTTREDLCRTLFALAISACFYGTYSEEELRRNAGKLEKQVYSWAQEQKGENPAITLIKDSLDGFVEEALVDLSGEYSVTITEEGVVDVVSV